MFVDEAKIYVRSGDGGNGIVAFRREKYVPHGGPAGGDGGRGGDVVFEVDSHLSTLMDFKYKRHYKAQRGEHGQGKNMHGANAPPLIIKVPPGTVIKDASTGQVLADLTLPGQRFVAAKGGRGGRGNSRFATAVNRAPAFAEKGEPGEEKWLILELKLLADAGLIGFPNAGKSTLISKVSAAKPKIADYPFTTLVPNLGVVSLGPGESFVIADVPGLIQGAHQGMGLGLEFLRHVERTKVLVFVLDCSGMNGRNPWDDYQVLIQELSLYRSELLARPRVIAANKIDVPGSGEVVAALRREIKEEIFPVSALTGEGLPSLVRRVYELIQESRAEQEPYSEPVVTRFIPLEEFIIQKEEGKFVVKGRKIEKLVAMTDLENEEALARFQRIIERMGVERALKEHGVQPGDTVCIGEWEFVYSE